MSNNINKKKITLKKLQEDIVGFEPLQALEYLYKMQELYSVNATRLIDRYKKKLKALEEEKKRFKSMCVYEEEEYNKGINYIAGIDEAGRGSLAGPVVSSAVILSKNIFIEGLNDSKKLSPAKRERIFLEIQEKAVNYGIGIVDEKCIDEINILNATKLSMINAVNSLKSTFPELLLIDAVHLDDINIKQIVIDNGDNLSISIAAASIMAKVTRDRIMEEMDLIYPEYGFARNKGYGTKEHIDAIIKHGICPIHRLSFVTNFTK